MMVAKKGSAKQKSGGDERLEKYNQVVGSAELETVQLLDMSFEVKPAFFAPDAENTLSYDIDFDECHYSDDKAVAMALVNCGVLAKNGEEEDLIFSARYSVVYSFSARCDDEAVEAFLKRVAVFTCFPYFRTMFANVAWAANTHLPPLPVHKEPVAPKKKATQKTKTLEHSE